MSNLFVFGCISDSKIHAYKSKEPKNVLVLWFSQTGHTEIYGKLIGAVWEKMGLNVTCSEIREFYNKNLNEYDLVLIAAPVFNYDIPGYVKDCINSLKQLNEIPVASFVSYGGPEGDQHNAASIILELLSEKGGIPVGMATFMNMGAYPPVWDDNTISSPDLPGNKTLPDEETYNSVRAFAGFIIDQVGQGKRIEVDKHITLRRLATVINPIFWTKLAIKKHSIDKDTCIQCGTCKKKCPANAIDPSEYVVNRDRCVMCFGCINNCPQNAIIMTYSGRRLFGFKELLKRKNIKIKEPEELQVKS
jgi:ferredoxin/flavodoxin